MVADARLESRRPRPTSTPFSLSLGACPSSMRILPGYSGRGLACISRPAEKCHGYDIALQRSALDKSIHRRAVVGAPPGVRSRGNAGPEPLMRYGTRTATPSQVDAPRSSKRHLRGQDTTDPRPRRARADSGEHRCVLPRSSWCDVVSPGVHRPREHTFHRSDRPAPRS